MKTTTEQQQQTQTSAWWYWVVLIVMWLGIAVEFAGWFRHGAWPEVFAAVTRIAIAIVTGR
jgi:hypothetical protein